MEMSGGLEEAEYWLPSEFLSDDDILMDNKENLTTQFCFPTEFPYEFDDSVVNSSDEEDQLAELTRRLSLQRSHNPNVKKSCWTMARSPQSTLVQVGAWTGWSPGSSNGGSPNGPSQVTSPPTTPLGALNNARDLIHQAAGQVARLKINGMDTPVAKNRIPPGLQNRPAPTLHNSNIAFQDPYVHVVREEQMSRQQQQQQRCAMWSNGLVKNVWAYQQKRCAARFGTTMEDGECCRGETAWPSLQYMRQPNQQIGSGMRDVSLGGGSGSIGVKKKCAGTGVFLPRRYGSNNYTCENITKPAESRKRPGYPPALFPARVVQALNKSFSDMNGGLVQPHCLQHFDDGYVPDYDSLLARRNALLMMQQRRHLQAQGMVKHGLSLPQEWTY